MREWESDPLFAAAEVVQDSADRMESIFRLLLHEQSLVHEDRMHGQISSSIEGHKRDLATALETTKWQLEDFEREVNFSAIADKFKVKQNVIRMHMEFIKAVREQIIHVEQSLNTSAVNSLRNMNFNEQDRDVLALFLSGKEPVKHMEDQESKDKNIFRRFLDPVASSSSEEDSDEKNANGISYLDHNLELQNYPTEMDLGTSVTLEEDNNGRYDEEGTWDLEANQAKRRSYLQTNKLRDYCERINIFGSLGNLLSVHRTRISRSFTKRLKDGEEERQSQLFNNVRPGMQRYLAQLRSAFGYINFHLPGSLLPARAMQSSSWMRDYKEKCHRSIHHIQARVHPVPYMLALLLTLLILSILVL